MAYRSAYTEILAAVLRALRATEMATCLGVDPTVWASTASPRVMVGDRNGYIGGLHRGRLPAIELWKEASEWERTSVNGGTMVSHWRMRFHHNGPTQELAEAALRVAVGVAFTMIRSNQISGLDVGATETIGEVVPSPYGFQVEAVIDFDHSYGVDDFTVEQTA